MINNGQAAPSTRRTSIGVETPPFLQPFVDHVADVLVMTNLHTRVLLQPLSPPRQSQQVTDYEYDACYNLAFLWSSPSERERLLSAHRLPEVPGS